MNGRTSRRAKWAWNGFAIACFMCCADNLRASAPDVPSIAELGIPADLLQLDTVRSRCKPCPSVEGPLENCFSCPIDRSFGGLRLVRTEWSVRDGALFQMGIVVETPGVVRRPAFDLTERVIAEQLKLQVSPRHCLNVKEGIVGFASTGPYFVANLTCRKSTPSDGGILTPDAG